MSAQLYTEREWQSAVDGARDQLAKVVGAEAAERIMQECMFQSNLAKVTTAQHLLEVAQCLCCRGGIVEVIGRALKVQSLLGGARTASAPTPSGGTTQLKKESRLSKP